MKKKRINLNKPLGSIISNFEYFGIGFSGTKCDADKIIAYAYSEFSKLDTSKFFFPRSDKNNFKIEFEKIFGELPIRSNYTSDTIDKIFSSTSINTDWVLKYMQGINDFVGRSILTKIEIKKQTTKKEKI